MIKKDVKRILLFSIISIMMFNFIFSNLSFATDEDDYTKSDTDYEQEATQNQKVDVQTQTTSSGSGSGKQSTTYNESAEVKEAIKKLNVSSDGLDAEMAVANSMDKTVILDGLVGIFTYFEKVKVVIVGGVFQFLATVVGESAGTVNNGGTFSVITPGDILFNRLAITDINFFNLSTFGPASNQKNLPGNDNPIKLLKQSVANWYMTLRTMAIIILLCVLVYIGIRMVLASNPETKKDYKKMLVNWFVSLAMVFLLHYLIIIVINVNNVFVDALYSAQNKALNLDNNSTWMSNYINVLVLKSFTPLATIGWSSAIVYVCIVALTFIFLIMYVKRMITIAFLILISPIITITYSIDKVGNGKAEAFSSWFKEFMHNVLIQPFHCIIYVAFVSISMKMLQSSGTLAASMIVIITMFFILQAEDLINKIFGIDSKSTGSALATAAVLSSAYGKLKPGKEKVARVATNGKAAMANMSKAKSQASSLVAKNNIAASNASAAVAGASTATAVNASNRLNEQLSSGAGAYEDYQSTMSTPQEEMDRKINQANLAGASDYDDLMGNTMPRNRIMGKIGTIPVQNTASAQQAQATNGPIADVPMPDVKNNKPQSDWEGLKDGVKGLGKIGWAAGKGIYKKGSDLGIAGGVIGASLAGLGGQDIATTIGAAAVGQKIENYVETSAGNTFIEKKEELEQKLKDIDMKNNERTLATAFSNHKDNAKYDKKADIQQAREYLGMNSENIKNIQNKSERQYVQALHAMRSIYSKENYDEQDPNERVIETMEKIIDEDIKPNAN